MRDRPALNKVMLGELIDLILMNVVWMLQEIPSPLASEEFDAIRCGSGGPCPGR